MGHHERAGARLGWPFGQRCWLDALQLELAAHRTGTGPGKGHGSVTGFMFILAFIGGSGHSLLQMRVV